MKPRLATGWRLAAVFAASSGVGAAGLGALVVAGWLAATAVPSCVAPATNHDEARYGVLRVAFGPSLDGYDDWRPDQVAALRPALLALARLGPTVVVVAEGADPEPDVVVRPAVLPPGVGARYTLGTRYVEVDPAQAPGTPALQSVAAHDVMHFWVIRRYGFRGHVCAHAGAAADCHPRVFGEALLNPAALRQDDGPSFDEAWTGDFPVTEPTHVDVALVLDLEAAR